MSFGFSVGDFVIVGKLIAKIVEALRGSRSQYQELIRELESLGRALKHVDKLKGRGDQTTAIDQVKCAALTCRYPLEGFLAKAKQHENSLGLGKSSGAIKDFGYKIRWGIGKKDEVNKLRQYLNIHIGTINMLLAQQGLEMLELAAEQTHEDQEELKNSIEDSTKELRDVRGDLKAQALAVKDSTYTIQKLFRMVAGDVTAPLKALAETVTRVCVSTQQIYSIVLEIRANMLGIDTRFTYFQAPVRVEDALGRVFPFPSECGIEALNIEIMCRFQQGPGRRQVMNGEFEIFNGKNVQPLFSVSEVSTLLPGMSVIMAVVLKTTDESPMPHCHCGPNEETLGSGKIRKSRKRKRELDWRKTIFPHVMNAEQRKKIRSARNAGSKGFQQFEEVENETTYFPAFKSIEFEIMTSTTLQNVRIEITSPADLGTHGNALLAEARQNHLLAEVAEVLGLKLDVQPFDGY